MAPSLPVMALPLRAISLSRPWPFPVLHLNKTIENRSDKRGMPPMCRFRGRLYLHQAKSWDKNAVDWMRKRKLIGHELEAKLFLSRDDPGGIGIVGRCEVVAHVEPFECDECDGCGDHEGGHGAILTACGTCGGSGRVGRVFQSSGGSDTGEPFTLLSEKEARWWMGGYALVLANVVHVPFVPCKGRLGIWTIPEDTATVIRRSAA